MYFLLKQTSVGLIANQKHNNYSIYNKIHKNDHNYVFACSRHTVSILKKRNAYVYPLEN